MSSYSVNMFLVQIWWSSLMVLVNYHCGITIRFHQFSTMGLPWESNMMWLFLLMKNRIMKLHAVITGNSIHCLIQRTTTCMNNIDMHRIGWCVKWPSNIIICFLYWRKGRHIGGIVIKVVDHGCEFQEPKTLLTDLLTVGLHERHLLSALLHG